LTNKQTLESLANERNTPCVSISLNTHRTHPDNEQDIILLKNLLKEAEERVILEFGKRPVSSLLEKIANIGDEIDPNFNLDSLHIYLSNSTKEIIRSTWNTNSNSVHISDSFDIRSLMKSYNRTENYYILLLSQSGVKLFSMVNEKIISEYLNDDFPFHENRHYNTHSDKGSDSKHLDDLVREFMNKIDKAVVNVFNETGLHVVVISTEDNFSRLSQVMDKHSIYLGHANIDNNHIDMDHIASQGWDIVKELQHKHRKEAILEMKEAVGQGIVSTDLQEIFQASLDGRGDLLIVHQDFAKSVRMTGDRTFDIVLNQNEKYVIEDITSMIAWNVLSKKGRIYFTTQEEIKDIGQIALKMRY
jgi:hypothetical protein